MLVAVDKFTKWVEAKPIKKLDGPTATSLLKEIIFRYGYPHCRVTLQKTKNFLPMQP